MDDSAAGQVEVWRGEVPTWECDEMGHLNVRHYVARAMEGLVLAASALGMPEAFAEDATATLIVREHHIRFLKEARAGAPLHMTAGVLEMGETDAVLLQVLTHSLAGQTAATFVTRVAHAASRSCKPFPWPERTRRMAQALATQAPPNAGPRTLGGGPVASGASRAQAERLGLKVTGRGAVRPQDCDTFGRMRTELVMGRLSDGMPHFAAPLREAATQAAPDADIGGAALEYRLVYCGQPRVGDPMELRSGFAEIRSKYARMVHWLLDARTGAPYATAEHVGASLDLQARRLLPLPDDAVARAQSHVTPGLAL